MWFSALQTLSLYLNEKHYSAVSQKSYIVIYQLNILNMQVNIILLKAKDVTKI